MSFIPLRVLTNCHIWLMGVDKVTNTCQIYYLKWWLIDIQSILPIDYRKNLYNRTIIGLSKTSNEFYLQRDHIDIQTNRRQRCFIYIIKKIYSYTTNDSIYFHGWVLHTHSTNKQKQKIEPPPVAPRRQKYLQTEHTHKRTNRRQHFPRQHILREGSPLVRGGSSRPIRRRHFSMYCY